MFLKYFQKSVHLNMSKQFFLLIILLPVFSCNDNENIAGGPCSYKETPFTFSVINVYEPYDSAAEEAGKYFQVVGVIDSAYRKTLRETACFRRDTIFYSEDWGSYAEKNYIEKKNVQPGRQFKGKVMEIEDGNCDPCMVVYYWEDN